MEKKKLNKLLLISLIIGVLYAIYSIWYWTGTAGSGANTAEQILRSKSVPESPQPL